MTKIKYELADGRIVEIDVSDKVGEVKIEFDAEDEREAWRNRKRKDKSLNYLESLGVEFPDETANIEEEYIKKQENEALLRAIEKLQPQQKEIINQIYFDGKTQAQLAAEYGIGESAIRSRLKKIFTQLKKYLENF